MEIDFRVPVAGDDPTPAAPVQYGDTATFELSNALVLSAVDSYELMVGTTLVGHVRFETGSDSDPKIVHAIVKFDGAPEVFDGESGYNNVQCHIGAAFTWSPYVLAPMNSTTRATPFSEF